jgi:putative transposase
MMKNQYDSLVRPHVRTIIFDGSGQEVIPKSIQLVAGRTGQEYNQRKSRKGAFWEDRYHATAVEHGDHLIRCLVYIDLNMARAGVVSHPSAWPFSGYSEIQAPGSRYTLIDYEKLQSLLGISSYEQLKQSHRSWVEKSFASMNYIRQNQWTDSIAVGGKGFVEELKIGLGIKARGRLARECNDAYELREPRSAYGLDFALQNDALRSENTYFLDGYSYKTIS